MESFFEYLMMDETKDVKIHGEDRVTQWSAEGVLLSIKNLYQNDAQPQFLPS